MKRGFNGRWRHPVFYLAAALFPTPEVAARREEMAARRLPQTEQYWVFTAWVLALH